MSIPITCAKDILFHVLYGSNVPHISALIEESVLDLSSDYNNDRVNEALALMRPKPTDSINVLRIKFFMLLYENDAMKKRISSCRGDGLIAPVCVEKARLFYDELCDELIPEFLQVMLV